MNLAEGKEGKCSKIFRVYDKMWNLDLVAKISNE